MSLRNIAFASACSAPKTQKPARVQGSKRESAADASGAASAYAAYNKLEGTFVFSRAWL